MTSPELRKRKTSRTSPGLENLRTLISACRVETREPSGVIRWKRGWVLLELTPI